MFGQEHLASLLRSFRTGGIPPASDPAGRTVRRLAQLGQDEPATLAHVELDGGYTITMVGIPYRPDATFAADGHPVTLFEAEGRSRFLARYIQIQRTDSRIFAVQLAGETGRRERSIVWYGKDPIQAEREEAFSRFRLISIAQRTSEGGRPLHRATRVSDQERREIARQARELRDQGTQWAGVVDKLGYSESTHQRWIQWLDEEEGRGTS